MPAYPSADAVMSGVAAETAEAPVPGRGRARSRAGPSDQRNAALLVGQGLARATSPRASRWARPWRRCSRRARGGGRDARTRSGTQGAVGRLRRRPRLARGEIPWIEPRHAAPAADAAVLRPGAGLGDDPDRRRGRAPGAAAVRRRRAQMQQELAEVKSVLDHVTREQVAIANKWSDGAGTVHAAGPLERHRGRVHPRRPLERGARRRARSRCSTCRMHDAAVGCWEAKYSYFNPRPTTSWTPAAKTAIGTPELPGLHVGPLDVLGAAAAVLSLPASRPAPRASRR